MNLFNIKKANAKELQWLIWALVFIISFLPILTERGFAWALCYTIINIGFYAFIIYGNIYFLLPHFYEKNHKIIYVILVLISLAFYGFAKLYLTVKVYEIFNKTSEAVGLSRYIYTSISGILVFLMSFIFKIAIAYFSLKQHAEDILLQKAKAELNLLKSQVQPHFLFNTLNNIYYEAYIESPKSAKLIERLSDMMRYFVDESPKNEVSISTEISFLENYIELEKIRIRHQIQLSFIKECDENLLIPPMLLMTFVENIFKHGIDKSSDTNFVEISLIQTNDELIFETKNNLYKKTDTSSGFGIENLKKRLSILYGNNYELLTENTDQFFIAYFKIPLA